MSKIIKLNNKFFSYACTRCGSCKEIFPKNFEIKKNKFFLKKKLNNSELKKLKKFCPGIGFSYLKKNNTKYSNLIGHYEQSYIGYSLNSKIRSNSASGGIITEILINLIKEKKVDYVLMPIQGSNHNVLPSYQLTNNINLIKKNSQSIYTKIPINNLLNSKNYKIAFVGLPDQISSVRRLVKMSLINNNIKLFIGPMVGINMDSNSLNGIRLSYNIYKNIKIKRIKWREGKWPGYLSITYENNKKIKLNKFYYNFLLPFYCSHESLLSVDFTNEDADISVGDAWSPKYENTNSKGMSLIWSKNLYGDKLLKNFFLKNKLYIKKISYEEAIKMHAHMLDFKKRGSQYRKKIYKFFNIQTPNNLIRKVDYKPSRYLIEAAILFTIFILRSKIGKIVLIIISPKILGPLFQKLRLLWKFITKKTKREGLEKF